MSLTPRQRELIRLMREGGELRTINRDAVILTGIFTIHLHFLTVGSLVHRGLIQYDGQPFDHVKHYSLTELGKTIKI